MGGGTNTTTNQSTSGPTNKAVQDTATKLAQGISTAYDKGPQVFNQSTFSPAGATTQDAWGRALSAANNQDYARGVNGAIADQADVASGKYLDNTDPNFQAMVDRAANGTAADINASIGADGRYGSNVHVDRLAEDIGNLRQEAGVQNRNLELTRQGNAIAALPGLFSASAAPSAAVGAVGSASDANQQGILSGKADLATRQANGWTDLIAKLTSAAAGNAAGSGTTTTSSATSPATPWWQSILGLGLQAL